MDKNQEELEQLKNIVKNKGLKYTKQREIIFQAILETNEHLNAEELHQRISDKWPEEKIGIATVYRALSFLEDVQLISSIDLQNNEGKKFEANNTAHHDHLICMKCNKIIEFVNDDIESIQEKVAQKHNFQLKNHTMYLFGICEDCQ